MADQNPTTNPSIDFSTIFDERELKVLEELAVQKEMSPRAVVRHLFRLGQMSDLMISKGYKILYTKDDEVFDPLQPVGPKMAPYSIESCTCEQTDGQSCPIPLHQPAVVESCNRHHDCKRAEADFFAREGRQPNLGFHCHDDECEDCFGS